MWWLSYFIGGGISMAGLPHSDHKDFGPTLDAGVSVRVAPDVGIGLHVRASSFEGSVESDGGACPYSTYIDVEELDVGLSGQLLGKHAMAQLWIGAQLSRGEVRTRTEWFVTYPDPTPPDVVSNIGPGPRLTGGFLGALDLSRQDPYRIALYVGVQLHSMQTITQPHTGKDGGGYTSLMLGIAHRR